MTLRLNPLLPLNIFDPEIKSQVGNVKEENLLGAGKLDGGLIVVQAMATQFAILCHANLRVISPMAISIVGHRRQCQAADPAAKPARKIKRPRSGQRVFLPRPSVPDGRQQGESPGRVARPHPRSHSSPHFRRAFAERRCGRPSPDTGSGP